MICRTLQLLACRRPPRLGALAHGLALGAAVLSAACSDATGPGAGGTASRLVLNVADAAASGDTLGRQALALTVALRDSTPIRLLRVYVDSASRPTPDQTVDYAQLSSGLSPGAAFGSVVVFPPTLGRHVITVAVTDTGGRVASASLTRTFAVPSAAYTLAALPDLGGDARGAFVHADGDVAGWASIAGGRKRPAVWHAGRLTILPVTDSVDVVARRVDAAGDALLQYDYYSGVPPYPPVSAQRRAAARVWRADGTLLPLGPAHYALPSGDTTAYPCCTGAGDLNDRRVAIAYDFNATVGMTARYDVAAGALVDTTMYAYSFLNTAGQMAGTVSAGADGYYTNVVVTRGFTAPALPTGPSASPPCGSNGHQNSPTSVVASGCLTYAYLSPAGRVWLDRYVGRSAGVHLSRQGGLVASLDSAGAVTVWTAATKRVVRVQAALGAVTLDGLDGVNAAGQVLVHGVDAGTKKGGAYLLTPAAR